MFRGFSSKIPPLSLWGCCGAALSLTFGLISCGTPNTASENQAEGNQATSNLPQVVATSSLLCDLTQQVAQETIDLTCLMPPELDPHVYAPTPSDRKAIEAADLVLYVGYGYEPDLIQIIQATNTPGTKVAVIEQAVTDPILGEAHEHDHAEDEHTEDEHATGELTPDPHVWHDPTQGIRVTETIRDQLKQLAPDQADLYDQNAAKVTAELTQINSWIKQQIATVPASARKLVTTHDSFRYFAQAYGFEVGGTITGLSTDERPSASHLAELVEQIKQAQVPAIFAEKTTNPQWMETLAKDANVKVSAQPLYVEGAGGTGTDVPNYQAMLETNTCTIVNALGGTCSKTMPN